MEWLGLVGLNEVSFFRIIIFLMLTALILLLERFIEPIKDGGAAGKLLAVVLGIIGAFALPDQEIVAFVAGFSYYLYGLLIIVPIGGLIVAMFKGGPDPGSRFMRLIFTVVIIYGLVSIANLLESSASGFASIPFSSVEPVFDVAIFTLMVVAFFFGFQFLSSLFFKDKKRKEPYLVYPRRP